MFSFTFCTWKILICRGRPLNLEWFCWNLIKTFWRRNHRFETFDFLLTPKNLMLKWLWPFQTKCSITNYNECSLEFNLLYLFSLISYFTKIMSHLPLWCQIDCLCDQFWSVKRRRTIYIMLVWYLYMMLLKGNKRSENKRIMNAWRKRCKIWKIGNSYIARNYGTGTVLRHEKKGVIIMSQVCAPWNLSSGDERSFFNLQLDSWII